jgi:hypothetical protein
MSSFTEDSYPFDKLKTDVKTIISLYLVSGKSLMISLP